LPEPIVWRPQVASAQESGRASSPEPIVWPLGAALLARARVAARLHRQARASAAVVPGPAAKRTAPARAAARLYRQAHASAEAAPEPAAKRTATARLRHPAHASAEAAHGLAAKRRATAQAAARLHHPAHAFAEAVPGPAAEASWARPFRAAQSVAQAPRALPVPSARLAQRGAAAEAAPRDGAVAPRDAAGVLLRAAALRDALAVLLRAAALPDAPGAALPSVPPSASAFRRDQAPPWPGPRPAARFARGMQRLRIAWP
jgi:hypothetical protein